MNTNDFLRLKDKIEQLKQQRDRAAGVGDALLERLNEEFNCSNLDEAEERLDALSARGEKLDKLHQKRLALFEAKWSDQLESLSNGS